jgi:5-methylcytosine-specific restriction endonuclease McrA
MKNPKNPKERNLIKGAIRRVFSRSELRRQILDKAIVKDYYDPSRKRVTRWGKCSECNKLEPAYLLEVDHIEPVVPEDSSLEQMTWDELVDRVWCDERNLRPVCKPCHKLKSKEETKIRRKNKKEKKENEKK